MSPNQPKHLKKGDTQPPLQKGLLRLYSMRYCPFAHLPRLILDIKKIPHDIVNINLTQKPDFIFEKNASGSVPVIEFEDGVVIPESLVIADFLDEAYTDQPLYPADLRQKAIEKLWIAKIKDLPMLFYPLVAIKGGLNAENFEKFVSKLEVFFKEQERRGTAFFGGARPNMVDLVVWPYIERAPLLQTLGGDTFKLPETRLPTLAKWTAAMMDNEAIKSNYVPPAAHGKYLSLRTEGIYDFEF